jgi:prepilin-type N-terminal cleavage/methylation domain-containing protein
MNKHKGFSIVELLIVVFVISLIGFAVYTVSSRNRNSNNINTTDNGDSGIIAILNPQEIPAKSAYQQCVDDNNDVSIVGGEFWCRSEDKVYLEDGTVILDPDNYTESGYYLGRPLEELITYQIPENWQSKTCDSRHLSIAPVGLPLGICQSDAPSIITVSSNDSSSDPSCDELESYGSNISICETRQNNNYSYEMVVIEYDAGTDGVGGFESGGKSTKVIIHNKAQKPIITIYYNQRNGDPDLTKEFNQFLGSIEML